MKVVCASKQRQVFVLSEAFRADMNSLLPAMWFTEYPEGINPVKVPRAKWPTPDTLSRQHWGWLLLKYGYLDYSTNTVNTSTEMGLSISQALDQRHIDIMETVRQKLRQSKTVRQSVLLCPNALVGRYDSIYDAPSGGWTISHSRQEIRRMGMVLLRQLTPLGSANMDYDIFASNYVINMAAGSTKGRTWWYPVDQLDAGAFYPVRDWPTRRDSTPSNIGYLFERNYLSGGAPGVWAPSGVSSGQTWNPETQSVNYMYATGIIGYNSRITWTPNPYYTGLPGYNPGGYHNLGTTSNMICADGHGVTLGDVYNGYGSPATYDVAGAPDYPYKWGIPLSQP